MSEGEEGDVSFGREEERGGGLGDGGVDGRAAVLSLSLSPSRSFVRTRSPSRDGLGWSADGVDILIFLSRATGFCLSASRSIDVRALAVRSSARTVSPAPAPTVGREEDEEDWVLASKTEVEWKCGRKTARLSRQSGSHTRNHARIELK